MISGADLLWGGVVPAVVAAIVLSAVWQCTAKAASAWRIALVVGYVAGHWALDARGVGIVPAIAKSYRVTEVRDWLPLLALLAIWPDALACVGKLGPSIGWLLRVALCLFVPWRLVQGTAYWPAIALPAAFFDVGSFGTDPWSASEATTSIVGVAVAYLISWLWQRSIGQGDENLLRSVLVVVVALGAAITVALSASWIYAQLLGVLAAALAGCGLASWRMQTGRGPEAAAGPAVIVFGSLVTVAYFFAELKLGNAALLLLSMGLATGSLWRPSQLSPRWGAAWRSVTCLGVLGLAVALAGFDFAAMQAEVESNPYAASGCPDDGLG